ncbi:MAG TPA: DUF502 domain-containing protein [Bdellovibrionota bacterium]|nr:DUF502 domain-containing protein [Bdellovibrionota bacterium]
MKKPFKTWLRQSLVTGLLALLPVSITVWILLAIFRWADRMMYSVIDALVPWLNPKLYIHFTLPIIGTEVEGIPALGIVLLFLILILIGVLTRTLFAKFMMRWFEHLVKKIPLVRNVYFALRQVMKTIAEPGAKQFRKVILVEFPRKGLYSIGFVTGAPPKVFGQEEKMLSIFVPTTPNPTTGFYMMVSEKDTIPVDLSIEDAFKMIISAGVLTPENGDPLPPVIK